MKTIPPFKLVAQPLNDEAASLPPFKWAGGEVGKRHRLGGEPQFLRKPEIPECSCRKPMTFYGQLDSINDEFVLADCGIIYVFVCFDCFETKSVLQTS
jgi:hypothetical protein